MQTRRAYWKERFKSAFWLTPTLTALTVVALLPLTHFAREAFPDTLLPPPGDTAQNARSLLSAIATAVMTVVGVLLSVTVVVLQQVSQQYTPRVIENFIRSTSNQLVFGFYVGTFAYAILLLLTLPEKDGSQPPPLALIVAIVLAVVSLALLIYYVHHLTKSIKSNTILAGITRQAVESIEDLRRDIRDKNRAQSQPSAELSHEQVITSAKNGYLQQIDWRELERVLVGVSWVAHVCVVPGDYIHDGYPLITLKSSAPLSAKRTAQVAALFKIDLTRTHSQDIRFGIRQMVDMALRALSPGINDPSTAIEALNEISTVLLVYTRTGTASTCVCFSGSACVYLKEPSYRDMVDLCVNEIAVAGKSFHLVQARIRRMLEDCETTTDNAQHVRVLRDKREQLTAELGELPNAGLYR